MSKLILALSVIGFIISLYAYEVRRKATKSPTYKALCDINDKISCTAVLTSEKGAIIGIANSMLGMILYALIFLSVLNEHIDIAFYLALIATLASIYLAYTLLQYLKQMCIVCVSTYIINILLLILSYIRL